ncbi:hypothetical protein GGI19_001203, partial [Coemansia pectinata]
MTDSVSSSSSPRPKRRRLFSRRELRRCGTQIVRVGSVNLLQSTRGPYKFTSTGMDTSSSEYQLSPEDLPKEDIDVPSDQSPVIVLDDVVTSVEAPITPKNEPVAKANTTPRRPHDQPMHKLTFMSEKARRLRISPESKRQRSCHLVPPPRLPRLDTFLPPSSPTKRLPPDLRAYLGGDISSFSDALPPVYRKLPPVLKLSDMAAKPVKRLSLPSVAAQE